MKNKSTIREIPVHVVNNISKWVLTELDLAKSNIIKNSFAGFVVELSKTPRSSLRWREPKSKTRKTKSVAILKIKPEGTTPWGMQDRRRKNSEWIYCDKIESIIFLTAWALMVQRESVLWFRDVNRAETDKAARAVRLVKMYRDNRDDFLTGWYCPPRSRKSV